MLDATDRFPEHGANEQWTNHDPPTKWPSCCGLTRSLAKAWNTKKSHHDPHHILALQKSTNFSLCIVKVVENHSKKVSWCNFKQQFLSATKVKTKTNLVFLSFWIFASRLSMHSLCFPKKVFPYWKSPSKVFFT